MGRPKKSDLVCTFCRQTFSRKVDLQKHIISHFDSDEEIESSNKRQARIRSNWCALCKKRFKDDDEYKLHIQTEHQYDLHENNMDDSDDDEHVRYESEYVSPSKKRMKREPETKSRVLLSDIKREPETESRVSLSDIKRESETESRVSLSDIKREPLSKEDPCHSLPKKIDQHISKLYDMLIPPKIENEKTVIVSPIYTSEGTEISFTGASNYSQIPIANMSDRNFIDQTGILKLYNMLKPPNISNENLTDFKMIVIFTETPIKLLEIIPKFDCKSEAYTMWLKKFVRKCKNHKYPLPQYLCDNINHVQGELASALNKPSGNLKRKSCHFYFMKMHSILTEVMLDHMRYKMSVTK